MPMIIVHNFVGILSKCNDEGAATLITNRYNVIVNDYQKRMT